MKTVSKSVLIWYHPEEMYALVTDVASYPQFLPWCDHARVIEQDGGGMTAEVGIAIGECRSHRPDVFGVERVVGVEEAEHVVIGEEIRRSGVDAMTIETAPARCLLQSLQDHAHPRDVDLCNAAAHSSFGSGTIGDDDMHVGRMSLRLDAL